MEEKLERLEVKKLASFYVWVAEFRWIVVHVVLSFGLSVIIMFHDREISTST